MQLFEAIEQRRSIKQYDSSYKIPEQDIQRMLEAAIKAPTSFNIQHWRFVRIQDSVLRKDIRAAAWDQAQVTEASELFLIVGNTQAWSQSPDRYWKNASSDTQQMLVPMLQDFYRDREWLQRDEAIRSGAMAAQNIMLAAKALGYDTNPMIGFDFDQVARLIGLPDGMVIVMMLTIGKAQSAPWPRGGQLPLDELLVIDRF